MKQLQKQCEQRQRSCGGLLYWIGQYRRFKEWKPFSWFQPQIFSSFKSQTDNQFICMHYILKQQKDKRKANLSNLRSLFGYQVDSREYYLLSSSLVKSQNLMKRLQILLVNENSSKNLHHSTHTVILEYSNIKEYALSNFAFLSFQIFIGTQNKKDFSNTMMQF